MGLSQRLVVVAALVIVSSSAAAASDRWSFRLGGGPAFIATSDSANTLGRLFTDGNGGAIAIGYNFSPWLGVALEGYADRFPVDRENPLGFLSRAQGSGYVFSESATALSAMGSLKVRFDRETNPIVPYLAGSAGLTRVAYDYQTREAHFGGPVFRRRDVAYRDTAPAVAAAAGTEVRLGGGAAVSVEGRFHGTFNRKEPILRWNVGRASYWTLRFGLVVTG